MEYFKYRKFHRCLPLVKHLVQQWLSEHSSWTSPGSLHPLEAHRE